MFDKELQYYAFQDIENRRRFLLADQTEIPVMDLGAGTRRNSGGTRRTISSIAGNALSPPSKCQALYRLILKEKPAETIEIGTSLGVLTAYLSRAYPDGHVTTIEGSETLYDHACLLGRKLNLTNVTYRNGSFNSELPKVLAEVSSVGCAIVDGDHRESATVSYYQQLKSKCTERSILIFDDIRWSPGMHAAWRKVCSDPDVRASIDFFQWGMIFYRKEFRERVALQILPRRWPPSFS